VVIVASWAQVEDREASDWHAKRVFVDGANRIRE